MFSSFKEAVAKQFDEMYCHQLYRTDVEKELLWQTYLESFPPGSNPMVRERREYDCQSCKSFIRAVGSMVAIINGEMVSLWDVEVPAPYDGVAAALSELVKSAPIRNILLHDQRKVGVDKNHQDRDGEIVTWQHFYLELPSACVVGDRGALYNERRTTMEVFLRALTEIPVSALETVIELIEQGSLYRGDEHLVSVKKFLEAKLAFDRLQTDKQRDIFVWKPGMHPAVTKIRSTVIGTLLTDIAEGKDLDAAVRSYEAKVAPSNYQRPKALVTKAMVERARKTVDELGYASALERRFATIGDVSINNVLFANRDARKAMMADVFDDIISKTTSDPKKLEKVEEVSIETFISDIFPKAQTVELLLENRHAGNLVNLVAPTNPDAKLLFKWPNNFSWSYNGDLADSIKERVKARGGNVTGDFRASLSWFNSDDLDLHLVEPNGVEISFRNKIVYHSDGQLDVDMNVNTTGRGFSRNAVENITYSSRKKMVEGRYRLFVHNFSHREAIDVGFEVEVEFGGEVTNFACNREVRHGEVVVVTEFTYSHKDGISFHKSLYRQDISKTLWGLPTQVFHPVQMVMFSPNHWDGRPVGNKHYFFMLKDCVREGSSRGFFNEYLADDLREHRKVFEIIGSKMRTEEEGEQLSGLGFSSTVRNSVYAKVTGAFTRTIKITF